jgi:hypothetical protein
MLTIRPTSTYYAGRTSPVTFVVLHSAQTPCDVGRAEGIMRYLARDDVRASAHWGVDPATTVGGVDEADTAWAAPGGNANGIQIEQAGYAEFGSGAAIPTDNPAARQAYGERWPGWDLPAARRMILEQTVPLVAGICRRWNLPATLLEPADLRAGRRGITDHARVAQAFGLSDHWDCGGNYPLAEVVSLVAAELGQRPTTPTPAPLEDDPMAHLFRTVAGRWLLVSPNFTFRDLTALKRPWQDLLTGLLDLEARKLVAPIPRDEKGRITDAALEIITDSALALYTEV